jgi:hypothetical protein
MVHFKVLSHYLHGAARENHDRPQTSRSLEPHSNPGLLSYETGMLNLYTVVMNGEGCGRKWLLVILR